MQALCIHLQGNTLTVTTQSTVLTATIPAKALLDTQKKLETVKKNKILLLSEGSTITYLAPYSDEIYGEDLSPAYSSPGGAKAGDKGICTIHGIIGDLTIEGILEQDECDDDSYEMHVTLKIGEDTVRVHSYTSR
jgi:hypothetical protein